MKSKAAKDIGLPGLQVGQKFEMVSYIHGNVVQYTASVNFFRILAQIKIASGTERPKI